jgi:hypothetical protein
VTYKVGFLITLALWGLTIATAGYFFVKGYTVPSTDSRIAVALTHAEREQILAEMRQLLKAVHGVLDGIVVQDLSRAIR